MRFPVLAAELHERGRDALPPIPASDELARMSLKDRDRALEELRAQLYAVASLLADEAARRARRERPSFPPYGLARSMHSQSRLLVANPEPWPAGSIDSFVTLGRAYLDTLVFHLDRVVKEAYVPDQRWKLERLEALLALFRVGADPAMQARMKDAFAFLYGGMQFGVSVCVQLTEVMAQMLLAEPSTPSAAARAAVIDRSLRPALRMAALNVDEIVPAYQRLVSQERGGFMSPEYFVLRKDAEGRPERVDFRDEEIAVRPAGARAAPQSGDHRSRPKLRFATQSCPARSSPSGQDSAIATLWHWCDELAHEVGLLSSDEDLDDEQGAGHEQDHA